MSTPLVLAGEENVPIPGAGARYTWTGVAPMPVPRFECGAAVVDAKLYVFGGLSDGLNALHRSDVYDPVTNEWTRIADMPTNTTHLNAVVHDRAVWYAGGFAGDNPGEATTEVWRYEVDTDSYTAGPPLPEARGAGTLVNRDGVLHYISGLLADRDTDSETHWTLNVEAGEKTWREAAPFPDPRNHHSGVALNGTIYVFGGAHRHDSVDFRGPWNDLRTVYAYDPETDRWSKGPSLPIPLSHAEPSTFTLNGWAVVAGGRSKLESVAAIWAFHSPTNRWIALPPLPGPVHGQVVQSVGGRIVAAGGRNRRGAPSASAWSGAFTHQWTAIVPSARLNTANDSHR